MLTEHLYATETTDIHYISSDGLPLFVFRMRKENMGASGQLTGDGESEN